MIHVKICGLKTPDDARACVDLGASAIGVNLVPSSTRVIDVGTARAIARAVHATGAKVIVVGVVADLDVAALRALVTDAELDCLQLHGNESPDDLRPLLPHAYKAVRVASDADVVHARSFPGDHILVDAKVEGMLGGSGAVFDWTLVKELARERSVTLAGGLHPGNVAEAVRVVNPYCVDVASGVESGSPGMKDLTKVRAFVEAARAASGLLSSSS